MNKDLTIEEMRADLAATERDIKRLKAIATNLRGFISDSGGENRTGFRMDLFKYEGLLEQGERLREKIATKMAEAALP